MITIYYNYEWDTIDTMGYRSNKYIIQLDVFENEVLIVHWNWNWIHWILSPYNWDVMGCTWLSIDPLVISHSY